MRIIGCDFHPSWQQVAWVDAATGETGEEKLVSGDGEAERFYRSLEEPALVGVEACGNSQWLIELLQQLGHEGWVGDAAQIRASYVRKQKTDKRDAAHILKLLVEGRFPRWWTPSAEQRDARQLLMHRHQLVEIRTRVKNGLQHLAMNRGMQKKGKLWSAAGQKALRELPLQSWAARRRQDLLGLLKSLDTDWPTGPGGGRRISKRQNGAAVEDAAGSGSDHGPGVRSDHRRCDTVSTGQAGGQLSGADSARAQFGRTTAAGCDQQAGQRGRRTVPTSGTRDFARPINSAAIAWPKAWPRWRQRANWRYDSTGCCAPTPRIRRSFASRAARGCPWSVAVATRPMN